ncbi:MAG TPA: helix-turn-helix domain-containing protein [Steroidobacteraceae bacterium]|nr:helix-turn-helix domain-containing protein [Steroidobacteraceae bacterium]
MADISRRSLIDTELEALLQPYPGWESEWIHLGPGPASLQGVRVACGSGTFTAIHTSSAGILRGTTASGSAGLIAGPSTPVRPRTQARPIGGDHCLLVGPAAALDVYLPAGSSLLLVAIPAPSAIAEGADAASDAARIRTLAPEQAALVSRCMELLQQIRAEPATSPVVRDAQRELRDHLRGLTPVMLRESMASGTGERARLQRHVAVVRACAFVDTHLRSPIALMDLCEAAGVSTRALEYGFRDFYGLGPMAYVRNLRLCRVRHDLLDPNRNDHSVSGAARRWSFTHMGQFSHDYRALFGEMPSMTLAAHQRAAKTAGSVS